MALVLTMAATVALAGPPDRKGKPEAKTETPAHGAPGADKGRKLGWSNGQKVRRRGSAPSPKKLAARRDAGGSKPKPATPPNSHAKAGKTTICHSTGSSTNPYVEITVSDNALKAHARHHDGRDIIPAPAEGCDSVAAQGVEEETGSKESEGGVLDKRRTNRAATGGVLGVTESNLKPQTAALPVAEEADEGGSLPFTGLALGVLLLIGGLWVLAGALVRAADAKLD